MNKFLICVSFLLISIGAFSQEKVKPEVIYVTYSDTISQELVDYIRSRTKPYILSYHPDMRHLIPEMRCRIQRAKRIGVFSVSKDKQVSFSQGNLQYHRKRYEWRFADNQYDYIGEGNIKDGQLADRIDLFGWSSDNSKAPFGVSTSKKASDYQGEFVDWGTNEIQGDAVGVWRTLSSDEWIYLFEKRKNAKQLYSKGSIDGLRGLIVLPDDCVLPEGLDFTAEPDNVDMDLDINVYTLAQWKKMEDAGAVFLCPTGRRDGTSIDYLLYYGGYWSSSRVGDNVKHMYYNYKSEVFNTNYNSGDYSYGYNGRAVRLVHDTIVPPPAPCETFEVNGVKFNMMCVEGAKFLIGQTEVTQGLWNEVMGHNNSFFKGDDLPVEKVSWDECQLFIQKLNDIVGLRFRLPTESEWEFAAKGGNSSRGYTYSGSNYIDCVAWYAGNSEQKTHPVASLRPNELGIYDMSGNVWEWCQDNYTSETQRVVRGGSFFDAVSVCRISNRTGRESDYRSYIGLRLVLDVHEYVDLGLSVMWATTNVGATAPEEYGDYFAWGEVEPKEKYDWTTYSYCNGTSTTLTKYCNKSGYGDNGFTDDKILLDIEDDVAHTIWGGAWRIPSKEEASELIEKCSWTWTQCNGIYGHKVTGVNGNSIFLPAASYKGSGPSYSIGEYGLYWLNELNTTSNHFADLLFLGADNTLNVGNSGTRCFGFAVRPVYPILPPAPCETFEVNGVTFNMMCVEGGTFTMGKDKDAHQVTLSDYYIGETEVTQGLWKAVMGNVPDDQEYYGDEYPVAQITLADCRLFAERLSQITGRHFRVPTEAEWEYAARGGNRSRGYLYAGSNNIDEVAWYKDNMTEYQPHPVAQLKPNELGTYDMTGNLAEWVSDWYAPYNLYPQINPTGAAVHSVVGRPVSYRGGCWTYEANHCLSTFRHSFTNRGANGIGLRLVMSDEEPFRAVYINDTTRFYLRPIDGGTFRMGIGSENYKEESGVNATKDSTTHLVTLSDYYMADVVVTQGLWKAVMGTDIKDMIALSPYPTDKPKEDDAYPMSYVRLKDAIAFIGRLNELTGLNFRLPTEAEWEYAARGGALSKAYRYPGSNSADSVSVYSGKVAQKMPNELGIFDMSGCVREMCSDVWKNKYIYDLPVENPVGPIQTYGNRVLRGEAYTYPFSRSAYTPTWCGSGMGFRLVLPTDQRRRMIYVADTTYYTENDTLKQKIQQSYFEMVYVDGGTFMMGAADDDADADVNEKPQHQVTVSDFMIGQVEVTQQLWKVVMGSNPSKTKGDNLPVEQVSWEDCQVFISRLNELTGLHFRLSTEAEWEYAARGGNRSLGYKYAGSDDIDEVAWILDNSGNRTHNVGTKLPNELGLFDMSGNMWEWCQDWYAPYTSEPQVNPHGPETGEYHMYRGGGWSYMAEDCRVTRRRRTASYNQKALGLRLVLEVNDYVCYYGLTDEQFESATSAWNMPNRGWGIADQTPIQGRILSGIRLKVHTPGVLHIYKVPSLTESTEENFVKVATISTSTTGLQNIDFAQPFYLGKDEYLVISSPSDEKGLVGYFSASETTLQPFYNHIGQSGGQQYSQSLMVDFY